MIPLLDNVSQSIVLQYKPSQMLMQMQVRINKFTYILEILVVCVNVGPAILQ